MAQRFRGLETAGVYTFFNIIYNRSCPDCDAKAKQGGTQHLISFVRLYSKQALKRQNSVGGPATLNTKNPNKP